MNDTCEVISAKCSKLARGSLLLIKLIFNYTRDRKNVSNFARSETIRLFTRNFDIEFTNQYAYKNGNSKNQFNLLTAAVSKFSNVVFI